jgi:hypothetical protein
MPFLRILPGRRQIFSTRRYCNEMLVYGKQEKSRSGKLAGTKHRFPDRIESAYSPMTSKKSATGIHAKSLKTNLQGVSLSSQAGAGFKPEESFMMIWKWNYTKARKYEVLLPFCKKLTGIACDFLHFLLYRPKVGFYFWPGFS